MAADVAQLAQMRQIAFDLGMAFGQAAMAEDDLDRKLVLFDAYHRSFTGMRLAIALKMRIEREARMSLRDRPRPEIERDEAMESLETERPERLDDRERERDRERVSLPILLRTLGRVADDAEALLPEATQLPTLREILARVKAEPTPATPSKPPPSPLRARLSGGTATLTLARPPGLPGLRGVPPRRSTGPP